MTRSISPSHNAASAIRRPGLDLSRLPALEAPDSWAGDVVPYRYAERNHIACSISGVTRYASLNHSRDPACSNSLIQWISIFVHLRSLRHHPLGEGYLFSYLHTEEREETLSRHAWCGRRSWSAHHRLHKGDRFHARSSGRLVFQVRRSVVRIPRIQRFW